ncbi:MULTISPECIES: NAD(P)/FAD-dependent oxidoreductase [Variovorax]|jgi:hydrogen cyanide synthase HcnB|uniref:NAD(P)/FAD-dependent oxidoreductase n=1 Tax=Variovorax TaxID=34072 RepID=UPI00086AA8B5|nr:MULTISPECIES: NAD(P)/FAD-dependent oxidoreductase [Variovorax]MBN8754232.1 FAD-dependent oxidoreductase [Variovorax sp.]ODU18529.1 MAG: FAD/NAD(P)-binding oxidoreductase [Variovorax sp. SCN 67-85]ODV25488.1 MAG: FAD/NAD(P)-binding oxidoreductase [Variovorax sp. SCN 67-20]OJZ05016.1 MAG: FAD/NAD(P)-binding oxidoreductase [Variovorax sp. 67-131]UKI09064.1 FAD-dependent oxidoreductase [Variovorax paradoxus]
MTATLRPVIVGAGPAGVRAAQTLVAHGLRPVVIDEAPRAGGQIYRRPPAVLAQRTARTLYGFESKRADALHQAFDALQGRIEHRPDSLVWNAQDHQLDVLHNPTRGTSRVPYSHLIVATGATDRVLPVPGWTLPGVYTLGGAQVALKFQGCAIGRRVVFMGTGPLLYLVAYQYAKAGVRVAAVLDTARLADQLAATPAMLAQPTVFAKGVYYVGWLRAHGIALHGGVRPLRVLGDEAQGRVTGVAWQDGGEERTLDCDAVGFGYALRSETQLADLLGCRFDYAPLHRAHLPVRDAAGRASVEGVYLAGDGAGIMGADAAEWAGERAALALLADNGVAVDTARAAELERKLDRITGFRHGLERAFPVPDDWAAHAPDDLVICRCENVTAGSLRQTIAEAGASELNRLKALSRVGMGRCQGRMCGVAAAEILAHATQQPLQQVGRLRGQAPIKPIPIWLAPAEGGGA